MVESNQWNKMTAIHKWNTIDIRETEGGNFDGGGPENDYVDDSEKLRSWTAKVVSIQFGIWKERLWL